MWKGEADCGGLFRWRKNSDDWVSAYRGFEVKGVKDRGRGRKTWDECAKNDLVELGLH